MLRQTHLHIAVAIKKWSKISMHSHEMKENVLRQNSRSVSHIQNRIAAQNKSFVKKQWSNYRWVQHQKENKRRVKMESHPKKDLARMPEKWTREKLLSDPSLTCLGFMSKQNSLSDVHILCYRLKGVVAGRLPGALLTSLLRSNSSTQSRSVSLLWSCRHSHQAVEGVVEIGNMLLLLQFRWSRSRCCCCCYCCWCIWFPTLIL